MNCQEEFFEVNVSVIVLVEVSEDVVTKLFCVCRHEAGAVYVHEGLKNQSWDKIRYWPFELQLRHLKRISRSKVMVPL